MNRYLPILSILSGLLFLSCSLLNSPEPIEKYCGYEMSYAEINEVSEWSSKHPGVYDLKNGSEIYSEINDTIRDNMPDTLLFELFLTKLTKSEVCIDAYVPKDKNYIEGVACIFMKSKFSKLLPAQRKIRIFSYTNPDGSGDIPFEIAIKLNAK